MVPGGMHQGMSISPDGSRFVRSEEVGDREPGTGSYAFGMNGPMTVRDTESGEIIPELEGICPWDRSLLAEEGIPPSDHEGCALYPETPFPVQPMGVRWSPDGRLVAVAIHPVANKSHGGLGRRQRSDALGS